MVILDPGTSKPQSAINKHYSFDDFVKDSFLFSSLRYLPKLITILFIFQEKLL